MPTFDSERDQVVEAMNRLTVAVDRLQAGYEAGQRADRRIRIALIAALVLLGGVAYQALAPVAEVLGKFAQSRPPAPDPAVAATQREKLLRMLPAGERARIERLEAQQRWVTSYLAANPEFHTGPAIALVLSQMAQSVQVVPEMVAEVRSMNSELRAMNNEVRGMNAKMDALPLMASDIHGMHGYVSVMAAGVDTTMGRMGRMGRMFPWP